MDNWKKKILEFWKDFVNPVWKICENFWENCGGEFFLFVIYVNFHPKNYTQTSFWRCVLRTFFDFFFLFLEAWNCRFSFANSRIPFKMSARRFVRHFLVNSSLQNLKSSSNSSGILKLNTNFLRLVDFAWLRFWFCGGATFEPRNLAAHQWGIIFRDRRRTRRELRKRFLLQSQLKSERNWWKKCLQN